MKNSSLLLLLFVSFSIAAQTVTVPTTLVQQIDPAWMELTTANPAIREDKVLNERLVDLVLAYEADSTFRKRKQHHRHVFAIISMLGYHWKAITKTRVKFVGTSVHSYGAPGGPEFTEYDIKYNMAAHLEPYISMACQAWQVTKKLNRHDTKKDDKTVAPYCDPTPETLDAYYFHNQLTPAKAYWQELDSLFFPCVAGTKHVDHENFGENDISLGMYGVLVSDCNHGCRPEIHPYEWIWWLEVNPKHDDRADEKRWLIGLFRESSNRFPRWSKPPRRGVISVPFIFKADDPNKELYVEHLVNSEMMPKGLNDLAIPTGAQTFAGINHTIQLEGTPYTLNLNTNRSLPEGTKWWVTDAQVDENYIKGYLNIAVSVHSVYTARVTVR